MPFYLFQCRSCGNQSRQLLSASKIKSHVETCNKCNSVMEQGFGLPNVQGKETLDEYRGVSANLDIKQKIADRAHEHFVKHELPRLIQKEGKEFAIRQGFIDEDGTPKGPRKK